MTDSPTAVVRWVSANRRRQEQACRSDAAAIDRIVDALERFRRCDVPAFERWFFAEFGPKYSELARRWAIRDFRKRMIDAIADEVLRHNVAPHVAYRRIRLRHEEDPGWEAPTHGPPPDSRPAEAKQTAWQRPLEALFGDRDETYPPVSNAPEGSVEVGLISERSRYLYRRLAAALHPDRPATLRAKFGALVDDFWFAVQRAYRLGDQATLERFAALVAVRTGCSDSLSQIPDLEPVRGELSVQRRRLEEALDRAQCSPAWQFATTLEHRPMLQAIRSAVRERLSECLAKARDEARALEIQLRALSRPPATRPRRAVRGGLRRPDAPPTQLSFDF